jgi:ubiquinone/menaquinone biosynthesis C-methylase UbiE
MLLIVLKNYLKGINMRASTLKNLNNHLLYLRSNKLDLLTKMYWNYLRNEYLKIIYHYSKKSKTILDIGCGNGYYCIELAKKGKSCVGIDPLKEISLDIAKTNAKKENVKVKFIQGISEKLPFKDKTFDVVLLMSVLQHVNDQKKTLYEIRRVLKDNGFFILSVPLYSKKNIKSNYESKRYNLNMLINELINVGFKINYKKQFGYIRFFNPFLRFLIYFSEPVTKIIITGLDKLGLGRNVVLIICSINNN